MSYWAYGPGFHLGAGRKTNERRDGNRDRNRRAEADPARARAFGFARKGGRPRAALDRPEVEAWRTRRRLHRRSRRAGRQFARLRAEGRPDHQHGPQGDAGVGEPFEPLSRPPDRSEEHTSELQSLMRIAYAVFCLKKQKTKIVIS